MKELSIEADVGNLNTVMDFMNDTLSGTNCSMKTQMQLQLVVEEIFVNIANYAYGGKKGPAILRIELEDDPPAALFTFLDSGTPYNPLERSDPDITVSLEERPIGGLGIFLVKKNVDSIGYEYRNGQNALFFRKSLK